MNDKTPQELFERMASKGQGMFKDFSKNESHEMMSQLGNSWNTIMSRAMESPEEWVKTMSGFYQDQFNLWVNMFNPASESAVKPARGDRRFSGDEWEESPVHNYLKQSYLLSSRWMTGMILSLIHI